MTGGVLVQSKLPLPLLRRGKVREVYEVDEGVLLLVASDRVSAFDVVMKEAVPHKGAVLTQMSAFWFARLKSVMPHHLLTADAVVESARLEPPIFSPATKAEAGHDENVTFEHVARALGRAPAERLRTASLGLYEAGRAFAADRGIIIADTKFEFGTMPDGELIVIDEILTPDSSRFWPADRYQPGRGQPSFDKQPLRDYLAELKKQGKWNGEAPPPPLPVEVVHATSERYRDAYRRITGTELE